MTSVVKLGDYQVGFEDPEVCNAFLEWLNFGPNIEEEDNE